MTTETIRTEIAAAIEKAAKWIATYEPEARHSDQAYNRAARCNATLNISRSLTAAAETGGLAGVVQAADREIEDRVQPGRDRKNCRDRVIEALTAKN